MTTKTQLLDSLNSDNIQGSSRIDWVDTAKGICIILVVMMHTTLGLEAAAGKIGWMNSVVEFSKPFRMPDFFLISGLFLALTIDRPWRHYIDRKVVHFFYFYVLWVIIQFAFKAPYMVQDGETVGAVVRTLVFSAVQPFGILWFIYLLPVFFLITKLFNNYKWSLFGVAALLQIAPINTTSIFPVVADYLGVIGVDGYFVLIDEFASFFVYFLGGYLLAPKIFQLADWVRNNAGPSWIALAVWFATNLAFVMFGWASLPIVALALGFAGAAAIVAFANLIAELRLTKILTYFGAHSIVIYLAFFIPMVVVRLVMLKFAPWIDVGTMSLIGIIVAIVSPLVGFLIIQKIGFGTFLFTRPNWAVLSGTPWKQKAPERVVLHPAE